ncbi:MAG TPA: hypothetical protein V6D15_13830 [Oculatellaceae cyanobacterium]|jgi:hypothetical protein
MATKAKSTVQGLQGSEFSAKTRLLLALWDMGGGEQEVKKGELTTRITRTTEKAADYQDIFAQLEKEEAIALSKNKISLSAKGIQMLSEGLKNPEFQFDRQIGAKTANALLRWIREMGTLSNEVTQSNSKQKVTSYEEFKQLALDVFDRLNRDYNFNNLVAIYRIRREIGEQVTRSQFNDWLLEMQANDILQLLAGSVEDSAPDKIEDSITTELSGLRCYAKRLKH